jgi:ABC-type uncharacterized transport system auxiliary subunit
MTGTPLFSAAAASVALVVSLSPASGCALFSRGASVDTHWYTPELPQAGGGSTERQETGELRLGRVTSGADLGLRIAYGDGLYRIGYYEGLRWTERPEQYVRRAVGRSLFEQGPFRRTLSGAATTLDVEVVEFEEVKSPTTHAARISLRIVLSADHVLLERTVTVSREVTGGVFDGFVAAMSQALEASASEIARDVGDACSATPEACTAP